MARKKNIIIRRKDGLFAIRREDKTLGFTDLVHATHFTGKSKIKKAFPYLWFHKEVVLIDLNRKGCRNETV